MNYLDELGINQKNIDGKQVFVFESHHYALLPWSIAKRTISDELSLVSFDYHTDTIDPFLRYSYEKSGDKLNQEMANRLVADIDYNRDKSVKGAIEKLKNDEHIKTAIQCGILKHALIISISGNEYPRPIEENSEALYIKLIKAALQTVGDNQSGECRLKEEEKRTYPESDIYMPDYLLYEDEDYGDVFRDFFLERELGELQRISNGLITSDGIVKSKYILDIDLDYFLVPEAAEPSNYEVIGRLINNAEIITIAKESTCVDMCSEGKCKSDDLLRKVLDLIERCCR